MTTAVTWLRYLGCALLWPLRREPVTCLALLLLGAPLLMVSLPYDLLLLVRQHDTMWLAVPTRNLCMHVATSYTLAFLLCLVRIEWLRRLLRALIIIVAAALGTLQLFLFDTFKLFISPHTLGMLLGTNGREAAGFVQTFVLRPRSLLMVGAMLALTAAAIALAPKWPRTKHPRGWVAALCLALPLAAGSCFNASFARLFSYHTHSDVIEHWELPREGYQHQLDLVRREATPINALTHALYVARQPDPDYDRWLERNMSLLRQPRATPDPTDSLVVEWIIGESHILGRSQLYGCDYPDEPRLMDELLCQRLVRFDNAATTFSSTIEVISNMLSSNPMERPDSWKSGLYVPAAMRAAGWTVSCRENQQPPLGNPNDLVVESIRRALYPPQFMQELFADANDDCVPFDDDLVALNDDYDRPNHHLTLWHIMGQHIPFDKFYPDSLDECRIFTPEAVRDTLPGLSQRQRQDIAHYLNLTHYNDRVVRHIIDQVRQRPAVVVYVSDHGEEVYDYRLSQGRVPPDNAAQTRQYLECQAHVPMFVWVSDDYRRLHPGRVDSLRQIARRPLCTDDVAQLVLHLANVAGPAYEPARDPLRPDYHCRRRFFNLKYDYDAIHPN